MIPEIFHQTWKTEDLSTYGDLGIDSQRRIKTLHPTAEYKLWTDQDLDEFMSTVWSQYYDYWKALNLNIKKIDFARYCILLTHGGIYCDLDIILMKPLHSIMSNGETFVTYKTKAAECDGVSFAGNAFMASIPEHPVLYKMLQYCINYERADCGDINTMQGCMEVLDHTGPIGLGKVVSEYEDSTVVVLHHSVVGNTEDKPTHAVHVRAHRW